MRIEFPGLPIRFEVNGLMLAGMAFAFVGMMGAGVGIYGGLPARSPLNTLFLGIGIFGMVLYFAGRIVQFVVYLRSRRRSAEGEEP